MKKINLNPASSTYVTGIILAVVTVFILSGVIFLLLVSNRLDIVMSSPSAVTYTYFMMIMDRIIAGVFVLWVLPLTIYQWSAAAKSADKTRADKAVSLISVLVLLIAGVIFLSGEMHFFEKYKEGQLYGTGLFAAPTIETRIFNRILPPPPPPPNDDFRR